MLRPDRIVLFLGWLFIVVAATLIFVPKIVIDGDTVEAIMQRKQFIDIGTIIALANVLTFGLYFILKNRYRNQRNANS